jgi:putative transposase
MQKCCKYGIPLHAMPEKFLNKYRISSARLQTWDYRAAAYFITICTQNREYFFGKISNAEMQLSAIGKIVETEWIKTPAIRSDMNLKLGEYIVMPNHFHAILIIGKNEFNTQWDGLDGSERREAMHGVSTPAPQSPCVFGPQSKNLASIIRGFKSSVTTQVRKMHMPGHFAWQPRFHDHIIRDIESFIRIQNYIANNPQNWKEDKFRKTN